MTYTYCNATNEDKDDIFKVYRAVMEGYISEIWGWNDEWQKNDFLSHYKADGITLVYKANELVGYSQIEEKDDLLFMRMLAILPNHQKMGIGRQLLESFVAKGKKHSKHLSLEVFKINSKAREFYEYQGFVAVGETTNSFVMGLNA